MPAFSWDNCPIHGRQLHDAGVCVSCRIERQKPKPSVVNTPIGSDRAPYGNQTPTASARRIRLAAERMARNRGAGGRIGRGD
jgi:hypothetical protein